MSARKTKVEFAEESGFDLAPRFEEREQLEQQFSELQQALLADELQQAQTAGFDRRLKQAANEAAGLAWASGYPLLVFPVLFAEFARRERVREDRQQQILARSELLMEAAV